MADRNPIEHELPDDLAQFERALASLEPRPARVGRARLMFLAGRASTQMASAIGISRQNWKWPAASALLATTAAVLAVFVAIGGETQVVKEIVYVERSVETPTETFPSFPTERPDPTAEPRRRLATEFLAMRRAVLAEGLDALPETTLRISGQPQTARQMLRGMFREEQGT